MTYKKSSLAVLVAVFVLLNLGFGIASFTDIEFSSYVLSILQIFGGFILLIEVGVKQLTKLSNLGDLSAMQYVTMTVALLAIVNGVLVLPELNIQVAFLNQISGFLLILIGLFAGLEAVTNK